MNLDNNKTKIEIKAENIEDVKHLFESILKRLNKINKNEYVDSEGFILRWDHKNIELNVSVTIKKHNELK